MLIAGGGIGGLAAAIALGRAGFAAEVFERAPDLREVGAGISLWPNATRILRQWGVLDALLARGAVVTRGEIRDGSGHVLHRLLFRGDAPCLFIHRAALHAILAEAVAPWTIHLDASFERFEPTTHGVRRRRPSRHSQHGPGRVHGDRGCGGARGDAGRRG